MASRSRLGIRCLLLLPPSSVQCVSFLPSPSSRPIETDDACVIEIHLSNVTCFSVASKVLFLIPFLLSRPSDLPARGTFAIQVNSVNSQPAKNTLQATLQKKNLEWDLFLSQKRGAFWQQQQQQPPNERSHYLLLKLCRSGGIGN